MSATKEQVVIALSGGEIVYFEIDASTASGSDQNALRLVCSTKLEHDVACFSFRTGSTDPLSDTASCEVREGAPSAGHQMDITDPDSSDSLFVELQALGKLLAVGLWTDNTIRLLALPTLQQVSSTALGVDTQVRAVVLSILEGSAYLLVGLGDGVLITFSVCLSEGLPVLTDRRSVTLGTRPISLNNFTNAGKSCIFAACDRPTVLYPHNGKLMFSIVNIHEVTGMAMFHCEMFPECLAMCSEGGLTIGSVNEIQKVHIQTFPLGEAPKRLCHCAHEGR